MVDNLGWKIIYLTRHDCVMNSNKIITYEVTSIYRIRMTILGNAEIAFYIQCGNRNNLNTE